MVSKRLPPKRTTPAHPKLKQSRLAGINGAMKSIRRRSTTAAGDGGLKQSSLANFGFQKVEEAAKEEVEVEEPEEMPARKKPRRKKFLPDDEIAETQFALPTQRSCADDDHDRGGMGEEGERGSVVLGVGMPPPPVTPKRKRVLEVPSSHSPPTTPFTPYSQREKAVDVGRLSPSPGANGNNLEDGDDVGAPESAVETRAVPFKTHAALGVKMEMDIKVEDDEETASEEEEPGAMISGKSNKGDRSRVIKSSQWWENEELTQGSSLAILVAGPEREQVFKSTLDDEDDGHCEKKQEYEQAYASENVKLEDVGAQLPTEPPEEADYHHNFLDEAIQSYEAPGLEGLPAARAGDVKEVEVNTTTTLIPINFRDDSPEPHESQLDNIPLHQDFSSPPSSTQDEEDEEEDEDGFHEFKPVRTQQFPSSFFHRDPLSPPSPGLPPSSQFLPEPFPPSDELGGSRGSDGADNDTPNSPVMKEEGGGSRGFPLTVSQLLPSSLMETFPMPPPMSQYDSDEYEFGLDSETQ